jgi:GDP-4-dehydro-6-deoxy-D-mannose reductase
MRSLVTGAFGFAGWHLVTHLLEKGDQVLGTHVEARPSHQLCEAAPLDVTDTEACRKLLDRFQPEVVYHLAGVSFGPDAERDFNAGLTVNVGGLFNVLAASARLNRDLAFVFISSAEVYGGVPPERLPIQESEPLKPVNNYGLSKLLAEQVFLRFERVPRLRPVIIRAFNHIGAGQRPDFMVPSFAQQLARIAHRKAEPVLQVGNLEARRDFSSVSDIVRGYRLAAERGRGVYNLCSGTSSPVRSILDQLIEISGLTVEVRPDPSRLRPSEIPDVRGSYSKAEREFGWAGPTVTLSRSLREVYEYWLGREG